MSLPARALCWLVCAAAISGCTGEDGAGAPAPTPTPVEVQVQAEPLSPFSAVVRWTTDTEATSPVSFEGGGDTGEIPAGDDFVTEHVVLLQMLEASTTYEVTVGEGTGFTGTANVTTPAAPAGDFRVLFDAAHGQEAGNADWIIDTSAPDPTPANPTSEDDWAGAYSSWGFELHQTGRYEVQSQRTGTFTHGGGALDLADYCAVIVPEPNNEIPDSGLDALLAYLAGGGGLLLIANHDGSDRDSDGWQSLDVLNELADLEPSMGWRFDAQNLTSPAHDGVVEDPREPLLHGPFGEVARMGFYNATTLRILPSQNELMRPILWRPNQSGNAGLYIAAGFWGAGKIVLVGDSAPADDGTGSTGNSKYDSWNDPAEDNAAFFLNATAWLCDDAG